MDQKKASVAAITPLRAIADHQLVGQVVQVAQAHHAAALTLPRAVIAARAHHRAGLAALALPIVVQAGLAHL